MYKVFIENKATQFDCLNEQDLLKKFSNHKFVEASGGIVMHDKKYLFIKRLGCWDIPKGKLDKGETPEQAAVREIEEECGLNKPKISHHITDTWHTYTMNEKKYIKKTYWYVLETQEENLNLKPQLEENITEVRLFSDAELPEILSNTYESIKLVIQSLKK